MPSQQCEIEGQGFRIISDCHLNHNLSVYMQNKLAIDIIEGEREKSLLFRGYRYALQDQDTTWPAAYDSVRRGYD